MKQTRQVLSVRLSAIAFALIASQGAFADNDESGGCVGLPSQAQLKAALVSAVAVETSGLDFQMWATVVDRDGVVCAVAFSGADRGSQWPGRSTPASRTWGHRQATARRAIRWSAERSAA